MTGTGSLCHEGTAYKAQILAIEHELATGGGTSFATYKANLVRVFTAVSHDIGVLSPQVPSSLQGDLRTVQAAYSRMVSIMSKATSLQSMAKSLQGLGTNVKLRNAGAALTAWVDMECPGS
ncbi:MAG TPA: hypothetical protein VME70_11535 [Mycobacteriales bacterium]|nr:hypothetical protein [Mycobacteriales bacterium]